ncbi:hypothetical protein BH09BAC6_BH09BAC6_04000 [soil metagenome]|jgi:hypothetical protein
MKAIFFVSITCLFALSILVGWSKYSIGHRTSVKITETKDTYWLEAVYDKGKTWQVQKYINQCMKPAGLFSSDHDYMNVTTSFTDKTEFHIKAEPGELEIDYNKGKYSYAAYTRMKKMFAGISAIVGER